MIYNNYFPVSACSGINEELNTKIKKGINIKKVEGERGRRGGGVVGNRAF